MFKLLNVFCVAFSYLLLSVKSVASQQSACSICGMYPKADFFHMVSWFLTNVSLNITESISNSIAQVSCISGRHLEFLNDFTIPGRLAEAIRLREMFPKTVLLRQPTKFVTDTLSAFQCLAVSRCCSLDI